MKRSDTRQRLLMAAGKLFAEKGMSGASIREIARKARVNVAAVNYHYGSKENLYRAVLHYVFVERTGLQASSFLPPPGEQATPQAMADALARLVAHRVSVYLSPEEALWPSRIAIRCLLDPRPAFESIIDEFLEPEHKALRDTIRALNPRWSETKARLWAFSVIGEIAFYIFARVPLLRVMSRDAYDKAFLEELSRHIAGLLCQEARLPSPRKAAWKSGASSVRPNSKNPKNKGTHP